MFELLTTKYPGRYEPGQLRTLQRRVRLWRAAQGPEKEVMLAQQHRPGEAAQTDFTSTTELGMTIAGQLFVHLLVRVGAAVLQLAVGDGVPVGVDGGAAQGRAARAVPARPRAALPPDGQLDGGDAPDPRRKAGVLRGRQAAVQRGVPRADAALRDDAAHDGDRREGAKRRRRGEQRRAQAPARAGAAGAGEPRLRERRGVAGVRRRGPARNAGRGTRVAEDLAAMRELDVAKLPEFVEEDVWSASGAPSG